MTRSQAGKYAAECKRARKAGLPKPERPDIDTVSILETVAKQSKKNLKITQHRLKVIIDQSMYILDFLSTISKDNPELTAYTNIQDAICNSLYELEETIKYI